MNTLESGSDQNGLIKAKILNRVIAKVIDFIIVAALLEIIPKVGYFAGLAYLLVSDGLFEGRSIGKRLIGLRVVLSESEKVCSVRESAIRNFIFIAGYIFMLVPIIGFIFPVIIILFEVLLMIGSDKGMRLGDEFAGTRVVAESYITAGNEKADG